MHLSVVTPIYKAQDCIEELYNRLTSVLSNITNDYEIIMVEDCGGDKSWELMQNLATKDSKLKLLQFSRNFGQHYGITAGLDIASGDYTIVMDCDLQDRPEAIKELYDAIISNDCDIVAAKRLHRSHGIIKKTTAWMFYIVYNYMSGMEHNGEVANFRIMKKKVVDSYCNMREGLRSFGGLLTWMGYNVKYLEIEHDPRFAGETTYTWKKLFKLASDNIIAFSNKPLKFTIGLGFTMSILSFIVMLFLVYKKVFLGVPLEGWTSMISSVFLVGGVMIFLLGVIGIYIGKIFDEVKRRPLYVVSKRVNI